MVELCGGESDEGSELLTINTLLAERLVYSLGETLVECHV